MFKQNIITYQKECSSPIAAGRTPPVWKRRRKESDTWVTWRCPPSIKCSKAVMWHHNLSSSMQPATKVSLRQKYSETNHKDCFKLSLFNIWGSVFASCPRMNKNIPTLKAREPKTTLILILFMNWSKSLSLKYCCPPMEAYLHNAPRTSSREFWANFLDLWAIAIKVNQCLTASGNIPSFSKFSSDSSDSFWFLARSAVLTTILWN